MTTEQRKLNLVFPYYYGAGLHQYGSALLWFGKLDCIMLPWASPRPVQVFQLLAKRAHECDHPLTELFELASGHFVGSLAATQSSADTFAGLGEKITRIAGVGPGGQSRYDSLREYPDDLVDVAFVLLDEVPLLRIACCQFMWRCYEYFLELSESADEVLNRLLRDEQVETGRSRLLAECLMNHYFSFGTATNALVTSHAGTLNYLAAFARNTLFAKEEEPARPPEFNRDRLASTLFENTMSMLLPPLTSGSCPQFCDVLDNKTEELAAAKRKCYLAADSLIAEKERPDAFSTLLEQTITELKSEATAIAEIDSKSWSSYLARLKEDRVLWAAVVGVLGGLTGVMPPAALAAASVTLLTTIGSKGVSELRSKTQTLSASDWCFVYELSKGRQLSKK